jgi:hypothetical protein
MSCYKSAYDEQTYKQPAQSTSKKTQLLAYADDIVIVGRSQSAVRNAYLALEQEAAKVGLKINENKINKKKVFKLSTMMHSKVKNIFF